MSNDTKQTAVEWYNQQIVDKQNGNGDSRSFDEIFEQAKEMEKQQIISDNIAGMEFIPVDPNRYQEDAETYYNETYEGGEQ